MEVLGKQSRKKSPAPPVAAQKGRFEWGNWLQCSNGSPERREKVQDTRTEAKSCTVAVEALARNSPDGMKYTSVQQRWAPDGWRQIKSMVTFDNHSQFVATSNGWFTSSSSEQHDAHSFFVPRSVQQSSGRSAS